MMRWRLRELMMERRVTSRDLARRLGISPADVCRMRSFDFVPHNLNAWQLEQICRTLGVKPGDLMKIR